MGQVLVLSAYRGGRVPDAESLSEGSGLGLLTGGGELGGGVVWEGEEREREGTQRKEGRGKGGGDRGSIWVLDQSRRLSLASLLPSGPPTPPSTQALARVSFPNNSQTLKLLHANLPAASCCQQNKFHIPSDGPQGPSSPPDPSPSSATYFPGTTLLPIHPSSLRSLHLYFRWAPRLLTCLAFCFSQAQLSFLRRGPS